MNCRTPCPRISDPCYLLFRTNITFLFSILPHHDLSFSNLVVFAFNGIYNFAHWQNTQYMLNMRELPQLPFGLRSAPYIFNQLSDALEWILLKCFISYVGHILDDSLIMEPPAKIGASSNACQASLSSMLLTFTTLGVPLPNKKQRGPVKL